jgi:hypothetical protein
VDSAVKGEEVVLAQSRQLKVALHFHLPVDFRPHHLLTASRSGSGRSCTLAPAPALSLLAVGGVGGRHGDRRGGEGLDRNDAGHGVALA